MSDENFNLAHYLRLYGLNLIEQKVSYELVLRVRVAATKFVTSALPDDLTQTWLTNPTDGIRIAQDAMHPLLDTLRHSNQDDMWHQLGLNRPNPQFQDYFASRPNLAPNHLPILNQSSSARRIGSMLPPSRLSHSHRLVTAQRMLDATYTAIMVVDAARQLWQNWQKDKEETRILEARRVLLEDAVRVTEVSQNHALQQALDPSFVENYLLASGDGTTYDVLFGETTSDEIDND